MVKSLKSHEISSLRFSEMNFGYNEAQPIFKGVECELPMDQNVWITGAAANGQSTLLKLLAVVVQPQSGRYLINDQDTTQMSFNEFLPLRKRIGYSFDYGGLFANRTLRDNLTLPLLYHKILSYDDAGNLADQIGERFSFARQLANRPAEVSGGLRKLVCVLRSLILDPEVLVMDDPFTGVDSGSVKKLLSLFEERRSEGSLRHVFFTSRDESWPEQIEHTKLIIENGHPRKVA